MLFPIFVTVVIVEFLPRLYSAPRHNKNAVFANLYLAVWATRVIDVPRFVDSWPSIERYSRVHFKQVQTIARILFGLRNIAAHVLNDARTLWYVAKGIEP